MISILSPAPGWLMAKLNRNPTSIQPPMRMPIREMTEGSLMIMDWLLAFLTYREPMNCRQGQLVVD